MKKNNTFNVLVVDDVSDELARFRTLVQNFWDSYTDLAGERSLDIEFARNSKEALIKIRKNEYDLIISDLVGDPTSEECISHEILAELEEMEDPPALLESTGQSDARARLPLRKSPDWLFIGDKPEGGGGNFVSSLHSAVEWTTSRAPRAGGLLKGSSKRIQSYIQHLWEARNSEMVILSGQEGTRDEIIESAVILNEVRSCGLKKVHLSDSNATVVIDALFGVGETQGSLVPKKDPLSHLILVSGQDLDAHTELAEKLTEWRDEGYTLTPPYGGESLRQRISGQVIVGILYQDRNIIFHRTWRTFIKSIRDRFSVPSLSDRKEDLAEIFHHIVSKICASDGRRPPVLTTESRDWIVQHEWGADSVRFCAFCQRMSYIVGSVKEDDVKACVAEIDDNSKMRSPVESPIEALSSITLRFSFPSSNRCYVTCFEQESGSKINEALMLSNSALACVYILAKYWQEHADRSDMPRVKDMQDFMDKSLAGWDELPAYVKERIKNSPFSQLRQALCDKMGAADLPTSNCWPILFDSVVFPPNYVPILNAESVKVEIV